MKKSEIKNGAILISANNEAWFKMDNALFKVTEDGVTSGWMPWEEYDNNMRYKNPDYNIIAVDNDVNNEHKIPNIALSNFLYKTDESKYIEIKDNYPKPFLSKKEKEILSAVDKKWKYIVRNNNGELSLHQGKPLFFENKSYYQDEEFYTCYWISSCTSCNFSAYNHLFNFIKSTDTKPYEIKELLK